MMVNQPIDLTWEAYWASGRSCAIRNQIVEHFYLLVPKAVARARRRLPPRMDLDVLESAAGQALIEAVERFDTHKSSCFPCFARVVIRSRIADALRREPSVSACIGSLEDRLFGRETTPNTEAPDGPEQQPLKGCAGWSVHAIAESKQDRRQEQMDRLSRNWQLADFIALSARVKEILYLYFIEKMSNQEIAELLGISKSRVSHVLRETIEHRNF